MAASVALIDRNRQEIPHNTDRGEPVSRILNVASALLIVPAIIFGAVELPFLFFPDVSNLADEEALGVTYAEIREFSPALVDAIQLTLQFGGLAIVALAVAWSVISLGPYRKGEKWAWYAMLGIGGIFLSGFLIIIYIGTTLGIYPIIGITLAIIYFILWGIGLALPAKEIFGKPSS